MSDEGEFPVAEKASSVKRWFQGLSWMWGVTIVCAAVAAGLTWYAIEPSGPEIVIHFADGHGLKPGDSLRYRGIEVGRVASVKLNPQLTGVDVHVELDRSAEQLASEGSRFWIVRPQVDLTGVSGLETAVGSKYIAVIPGEAGVPQSEFEGLPTEPPAGLGENGIEIVLRGDDRYGLNPGSPVKWRGFEVGQVISSSLSADALHVDTRIRIMQQHRRLLSRNSKFWATSGVRMGMGIGGFEMTTGTLETIARGGVAFITPGDSDSRQEVQPGDMFTLYPEVDDNWVDLATPLNLLRQSPPATASLVASWQQKQFGITRNRTAHASGLTVRGDGGLVALIPHDLVAPPEKAIEDSYRLALASSDESEITLLTDNLAESSSPFLSLVPLDSKDPIQAEIVPESRFRSPDHPEDCLVIRRSWRSDSENPVIIETIGKHEMTADQHRWKTSITRLGRDTWHGATVLAASDEKIIGLLMVTDEGTVIAHTPTSLVD